LDWPLILLATGASAAAGLATALGALLILFVPRRRLEQTEHLALGFAAGVMMAASFFSLLLPGIESAEAAGMTLAGAAAVVITALLIGAAAIAILKSHGPPFERMLLNPAEIEPERVRRIWIVIAAIVYTIFQKGSRSA
jgi:zinc transporter, ZIP family